MEASVILMGKLYKFLNYSNLDRFFQPLVLKNGLRNLGYEYLHFLARVSVNKQLQIAYFNHFSQSLSRKNGQQQPYYTYDKYLWGYSRILLWYSDFDFSLSEMNYREHFTLIINHLHTLAVNTQTEEYKRKTGEYKRNAFLALIYLLTFRERDPDFCTEDSPEYRNAIRLIEGFRDQEIHLSSVISDQPDRSLNQNFKELLLGQSEGNLLDIP
ncbi:hypothetical protein V0288_20125 [Pannus brasiliensis CCIBt3594]|uniref:Uncharacterized protein n=1 Tax=Pannus brasiliensis CCIBt3594 TaxID=1427578 RepID=A0AAW9QRE9_9CHRO